MSPHMRCAKEGSLTRGYRLWRMSLRLTFCTRSTRTKIISICMERVSFLICVLFVLTSCLECKNLYTDRNFCSICGCRSRYHVRYAHILREMISCTTRKRTCVREAVFCITESAVYIVPYKFDLRISYFSEFALHSF